MCLKFELNNKQKLVKLTLTDKLKRKSQIYVKNRITGNINLV